VSDNVANMLPLFKSHFSIGKSILTLDDPKKTSEGGSDSIFKIAKDNNLKQIILIEDSLIGFFEAYKRSVDLGIQLVFGLRLNMRNSTSDADSESEHKIIIFAKNGKGCKLLNKIYSKAFCDNKGFLDYTSLRDLWDEESLKLAIPFYDSFIHINHLSFGNVVPDISFTKATLFYEENDLALDVLLKAKVDEFSKNNDLPCVKVRSIYYNKKSDVKAFMAYKIICNRSFGKDRSLERPELSHFCSDKFSFEAWKEENVTI
jgi:DNA polymerase III alpha subunit